MTPGQAINGALIISEWLGAGGVPVPQAQSQARADTCLAGNAGAPCPHNYRGAWIMPTKIADAIRATLEAKNHMAIRVDKEELLGHCEICSCVLRLKVHTPMDHILKHTKADELSKFPRWCWMNTERDTTTKP